MNKVGESPKAVGWMLLGAIGFATMGAFSHALGTRTDWLLVALARAIFMFTSAVILARIGGVKLVVFHPRTLWMRSLAGSFSLVCNFYALSRLPVADAITLSNAYPLWIVLFTLVLLRNRPRLADLLGVTSGLIGVILIQQPHLAGDDQLAVMVALLSSVSTAVAMLGLHRLRQVDPRAVVAHFAGVASLVALFGMLIRGGPGFDKMPTAGTWGLLLGVGISGTIGQFFLTKAYANGSPTKISAVGLTQVAFAMVFDTMIWGRTLTWPTIVGSILVLAPAAWLAGASRQARVRNAGSRGSTRPASSSPKPERAASINE
jgi:drug/metabolite transporter (DMT)-like permease